MSLSEQPSTLSTRLAALAQRLGLIGRGQRQILERASSLQLPFSPLPETRNSIFWQEGPPLHQLVDLPRSALSGPVQEDKAEAHAVLVRVVDLQEQELNAFDLRMIDGISGTDPAPAFFADFESYAASDFCRQVRIISYKDFVKTISLALPRFLAGERINLCQASWHSKRVYWADDHNSQAFACAIAYARRRGLEISLPANLATYSLSTRGLKALQNQYHVLAMPAAAWSNPTFMGLLLDNQLPYARLSLLRSPGAPEFLLLPKHSAEATALGEGLRLAGAPDVVAHIHELSSQPDN